MIFFLFKQKYIKEYAYPGHAMRIMLPEGVIYMVDDVKAVAPPSIGLCTAAMVYINDYVDGNIDSSSSSSINSRV